MLVICYKINKNVKNPLELVDFFIAFACINYSYMVQYIREKIEIEGILC